MKSKRSESRSLTLVDEDALKESSFVVTLRLTRNCPIQCQTSSKLRSSAVARIAYRLSLTGSVMSESAATAWIIERLEVENTKMEEEMGAMDTCEEDSAGGNSGAAPVTQLFCYHCH